MQLIFFTPVITPRIEYIVATLLSTWGINAFEITSDPDRYKTYLGAKINYSNQRLSEDEFWLKPVSLLFETGISFQTIECFEWQGYKAFFKSEGDIPFDIFAASFYLITRYEEYLPHKPDEYGRYAYTNSLAFKKGFLHLPLANLWMKAFVGILKHKFSDLVVTSPTFKFLPTYDIDIAWNYLHKGFIRNAGGAIRSLVKGDFVSLIERFAVLSYKRNDPYDIFDWLNELHDQSHLKPLYFFLLANKAKGYDKNILPRNTVFQTLIKKISSVNDVGIHPSWQSGDDEALLAKEINTLKEITGKAVNISRQHYIRMKFPETYRNLINNGITEDYSMGYGSINGYRSSYCQPYKWYDLQNEETTNLTVHPFCYMEANSYYEQGYTLEQSKQELQHYLKITQQVNGTLITIFHNHTLGNQHLFKGWKEMYEEFCLNLELEGL